LSDDEDDDDDDDNQLREELVCDVMNDEYDRYCTQQPEEGLLSFDSRNHHIIYV